MTDKIVVFSTCGSHEEAQRIARAVLEARAAACVNIVPGIESLYHWQGQIEQATEWLLIIKTRRELFSQLTAAVRKAHSYEVPELVALPIGEGLPQYLEWINKETSPES